jgi:hypothetical protein
MRSEPENLLMPAAAGAVNRVMQAVSAVAGKIITIICSRFLAIINIFSIGQRPGASRILHGLRPVPVLENSRGV